MPSTCIILVSLPALGSTKLSYVAFYAKYMFTPLVRRTTNLVYMGKGCCSAVVLLDCCFVSQCFLSKSSFLVTSIEDKCVISAPVHVNINPSLL